MESIEEIEDATRGELVAYLEGWGTACFDDEETSLLRDAAFEHFEAEGPGHGPDYGLYNESR